MGKLYENKRKPKREDKKVTVGRIGDVPPGRGATVKLKDGSEVALFNVNGELYAVENSVRTKHIRSLIRVFTETSSNATFTAGVSMSGTASV